MAKAIKAAQKAATESFDGYLRQAQSTAAAHVPDCVIVAAKRAFRDAGGKGEIAVRGHGNATHPVCSVEVVRA